MVLARCRYTQLLATQGPPPFCCPPAGGAGQGRAGGGKDESVGDYQERKATTFLPATSEPGPVALRTPGWVWVPQHQDASVTLEEAYPFMVEGSLRSDGMFVDQDLYSGGSVFYIPWALYTLWIITAPNLVLARIVRSKKSSLAKSLYTRSLPFGQRVYMFGDLKGEHTGMAKVTVGKALELGHTLHTRLNTLDEGHRPGGFTDQERANTVTPLPRDLIGALAKTVSVRGLTPLEYTVNNLALTELAAENEVPIPPMVVDHISPLHQCPLDYLNVRTTDARGHESHEIEIVLSSFNKNDSKRPGPEPKKQTVNKLRIGPLTTQPTIQNGSPTQAQHLTQPE